MVWFVAEERTKAGTTDYADLTDGSIRQAPGSHQLFHISVLSAISGFIPRSHCRTAEE
jgi:hypothetical protein